MTKHDRRIEARTEIVIQEATIYGEFAFVRRLRAMARNAGKMAARIAARNPDALFTLAGRAGYVASRYKSDWGDSYRAADDDPHVVSWESLEPALEHRGRSP